MTTFSSRSRSFFSVVATLLVAVAGADEDWSFALSGVSETAFNPLRGRLTATLEDGLIATADDAVRVYVNDVQLSAQAVTVRDRRIVVHYEFVDGVNDVLILARGQDERQMRGDALLWAGDNTLVVDVVDAELSPLAATVSVALASNTTVVSRQADDSGTARFEHLPAVDLLIRAKTADGVASVAASGDAGSLLVIVGRDD